MLVFLIVLVCLAVLAGAAGQSLALMSDMWKNGGCAGRGCVVLLALPALVVVGAILRFLLGWR